MALRTHVAITQGFALLTALFCTQIALARDPVKVSAKFVPRKERKERIVPDPTKLSDVARVEIEADSSAGVTRVNVEVDDQFRVEIKKPPFQYDWDTLAENDGPHTIAFTAYNANGQTGVLRLKVSVLNRLNLGIDHYEREAIEALRRGDEIALESAARKAYKISTSEPQAIRVMALLIGLKGDVNRAFQMLEDRNNLIAQDDPITLEIKGFLRIVRAGKNANLIAMLPDLRMGMQEAQTRASLIIDETKKRIPDTATDPNALLNRGDVFWSYHRYEQALDSYERAQKQNPSAPLQRRIQLRTAMTLLRLGRTKEGEVLATKLASADDKDGVAKAIQAAAYYQQRKYEEARRILTPSIEARNLAALIVAAITDLTIGARAQAFKEVRDAIRLYEGAETQYAALALFGDIGDKENARKAFTLAMMNSPLSVPTLAEYGFQAIAYDNSPDRFQNGLNVFDMALAVQEEAPIALAGRAVALLGLKRYNGMKYCLEKLANFEPTAPDLFTLVAMDMSRDATKAKTVQEALQRAKTIDPKNFNDKDVPTPEVLTARMMRIRRVLPLTPAVLDRSDLPLPKDEEPEKAATKP